MSSFRRQFNRHSLHPWADLPGLGEDESTPVIMSGEGIYITDDQGRRMIDGPAGMWCMQTGYGRREIADAVSEQIMKLGYSTAFSTINPREVELARRIAAETPGDLNRIFFTTGGSTAVDSALRLCQLANNIKGQRQRKHILSRDHAYHGSTFLSASVTGKERDKTAMDTQQGNVHFLSVPCHFYHHQELSEEAFCDFLVDELESKILELGPENVMCFIAEPVMGSGGVIVPPADYNRRCWEVVKKYDIVYIADEVVTAFGRLGHWFASEKVFGIVPDIITFAKGLTSGYVPLGGFRGVGPVYRRDIRGGIQGQHLQQRLYLVRQSGVLRRGPGELGYYRAGGPAGAREGDRPVFPAAVAHPRRHSTGGRCARYRPDGRGGDAAGDRCQRGATAGAGLRHR